MTVREDRDEFANSGVQGLVKRLLSLGNEGYVLIAEGGWRGTIVSDRPALGQGAFVHVVPGDAPQLFANAAADERGSDYVLL